ncbi:hypothetical protein HMPREF3188_01260 [Tissierellia bacterium KA00581]|nr:hypothetical protein HMPREF3188_01260 [Tissierellia bacterium KA00581]
MLEFDLRYDMKKIFKGILIFSLIFLISSCGKKKLKDGNYEGTYKDENSSVKVNITVKDGKITRCTREERDLKNGKNQIKDENYAKDDGDYNYKIAQKAVKNSKGYADKLVEVQDINKVDSVSGATVSCKRFKEAVKNALNK